MRRLPTSVALCAVFAFPACSDGPAGPDPSNSVDTISVDRDDVAFGAFASVVSLDASALDADGNVVANAEISWSTDGAGVASVDQDGTVTSVGSGSTTIRARSGDAEATVSVTVQQVPVSLELDAPATTLTRVGATVALEPFAADSNGNAIETFEALTFESSDPSVVHVSGGGIVTANWPGSAEVSVAGGGLSDAATFSVAISGPAGPPVLGAETACSGGTAGAFACDGVDLVGYMPLSGLGAVDGVRLNDMWGWTDPSTSRQFALVGRTDGLTFVDVTDPTRPRPLGHLPAASPPATWRDVKVYQNHAYVVADGSPGHGVQVFDLTRLRNVEAFTTFSEDGRYTQVSSVHNIAINESTGFAYTVGNTSGGTTCGGGLHMIDLSSPANPTFAGCFADPATGNAGTGYTHDVQCVTYAGPDAAYAGREICIGSNETAISIADVTDKGSPVAVSTGSYPDARYVHQGWLTEDHAYFVQNDELDELSGVVPATRMLVWDISDLDDPVLVREHFGPTGATDHNMYVRGDVLFHSNYHFGLRVIDLTDPTTPVEAGSFDTHPPDDSAGFNGSWSNYPWFADGVVGVTSAQEGFFLVRVQP